MELRPEYLDTLWGITNNLHAWSRLRQPFLCTVHISTSRTSFQPWKVCFSGLTEQWCPTSCCAVWCLPSATQTTSDICVTLVVIASIIANAQRDRRVAGQGVLGSGPPEVRRATPVNHAYPKHSTYIFGGSCRLTEFCQVQTHFTSKSCVLLYCQRYCMALQQQASAKLCGMVHTTQNGITELS